MMLRSAVQDIRERINDSAFAKEYGAEVAKTDFAITLAKARKKANLTQKELADKLGMTQAYIAKLEGGEANPTLNTIGAILAVLGLRLVTQTAPLVPDESPVSPALGPASQFVSKRATTEKRKEASGMPMAGTAR